MTRAPSKSDSLGKRYFYKLSTNLIGLSIALVTQAIIPRGLGPKAYGDFHFLTGFFTNVQNFLDMGTSTCFFTKLSQRQQDSKLILFYLYLAGAISAIIILFPVVAHLSGLNSLMWPDQGMTYVYLAVIFVVLTWLSGLVVQAADAYGATVSTEKVRVGQKILGLMALLALYAFNYLQLSQFFFYNFMILLFLIGALAWIMLRQGLYRKPDEAMTKEDFGKYGREFYHYSHPLFIAALISNAALILDRWWLQVYGGSEQQGFYGFAYLVGTAYMLFTNAMQPLLTREFAIAYVDKDYEQMTAIFRRYVPSFYSLAAFFSCYVAVQADKVILLMGGEKFLDAKAAVVIMAFYPIHQSYGQLSGGLLFATDQTVLMRNISLITALIGIPITFFLVAPPDRMGLNAGATGLALKMVLMQLIIVNVQLYFNAKMLKLRFWRYIGHQLVIAGCLFVLALAASFIVDFFVKIQGTVVFNFILAGILYTLLAAGMACLFPRAFGLNRGDMTLLVRRIRQRMNW
jgi:O-antigen/teichoic acid export membrane protein